MQPNTILIANNLQYNIGDASLLGLKNAEIVTLAACETAKGTTHDGNEISGLAYVMERAGAKTLVASLWDVDDLASSDILTRFYENLQNSMPKAEAMRRAKMSMLDLHPFFWSPFILIGDST